jgi:hypothetical protein
MAVAVFEQGASDRQPAEESCKLYFSAGHNLPPHVEYQTGVELSQNLFCYPQLPAHHLE